jgi:hypothetical protein
VSFTVTAPLVLARDHEGKVHHCYEGAVINWLSDEQRDHLLGLGFIRANGEAAPTDDDSAGGDGDKPAATANKPVLIAWLVSNAVKEDGSDYTVGELTGLNKAQLWELIEAVE